MKLCAENVKLDIYVNDVLDKPIIISSGSKENYLQITIRNDGTVIRKWIRIPWIPKEFKIHNVTVDDLNDAFNMIKPLFNGCANQEKAFNTLQHEVQDTVKTCANNVQMKINIQDVIETPIVICTERQDNYVRITITKDGELKTIWTKETWKKRLFDKWESAKEFTSICINKMKESAISGISRTAFQIVAWESTKQFALYCLNWLRKSIIWILSALPLKRFPRKVQIILQAIIRNN